MYSIYLPAERIDFRKGGFSSSFERTCIPDALFNAVYVLPCVSKVGGNFPITVALNKHRLNLPFYWRLAFQGIFQINSGNAVISFILLVAITAIRIV